MASRVPLLLGSKSRKPTRLPIAPRAKPTNGDRNKRASLEPAVAVTPDHDEKNPVPPLGAREPDVEPTPLPAPVVLPPAPSVVRAGGIAPGGSLGSGPSSGGGVRSPILPVQRASEHRTQHVERLAKISAAGPVYRGSNSSNGLAPPPRQASPVLGPRMAPPAISTQESALAKRLVRKLDIKPHQSPRRAGMALGHAPSVPSLASAGISTASPPPAPPAAVEKHDEGTKAARAKKAAPRKPTKDDDAAAVAPRKASKRRSPDATSAATPPAKSARRSLRRTAKKANSYRTARQIDANVEDVDPNEFDLPEEHPPVYVPARERATMWAKSVLKQQEEADEAGANGGAATLRALVVKSAQPIVARRKRSNSSSSLVSAARKSAARAKVEELLKKEPSQMTMGELALTVPKGRRVNRHEQEVAADNAIAGVGVGPVAGSSSGSSLLNANALNRLRSFSVSSESAALGGSIVTPQVQIIDGKMVILESTVKISDVATHRSDDASDHDDSLPRRSGARYYMQPPVTGRRWGKDETKQFYYCLSQVGPNFSMMATLFPNRKRKELKCKFKYEEKHHPSLIEIALKASAAPLDSEMVSVIAQMVDKDSKKKQEKLQRKQKRLSDSPASATLEPAETPPPPQADFLDDYDDYYRERSHSFDFAG